MMIFVCFASNAQIIYSTDFSAYNNNDKVGQTIGIPWTTWSGTLGGSEDAVISNTYFHSDSLSMKLTTNNDCVFKTPSTYTTGVYKIEFYIYVPNGKLGYWNILQNFSGNNAIWGFQALIANGLVEYDYDGNAIIGAYNVTSWNKYTSIIDIDNDLMVLYLNDIYVLSFKWSHGTTNDGTGLNKIDAVNFFGWDNNGSGTSEYYIDDFSIEQITPLPNQELAFSYDIVNENDVDLTWNSIMGANNYIIIRDGLFVDSTTQLMYTDQNVYPAKYAYQIVANFGSSSGAIICKTDTVSINGGVVRENVLFETFTSIGCTYCPIAQTAMNYLINNNYKINTIDYHMNIYNDPYMSSEVTARGSYYSNIFESIDGTPTTIINGLYFMGGAYTAGTTHRDVYIDRYNRSMAKKSCFSIEASIDTILLAMPYTATLNVDIKEEFVFYTDPIILHIALIENNISKNWGNSYGTFTDVDHLQRKMYPSSTGTTVVINVDSTANYQIPITITEDYNISNCKLIVFLQNQTTGEILQSVETSLPMDMAINDNFVDNNISIYPNPTNSYINIASEIEISDIYIIDISGKEIMNKNINSYNSSLNVENFANGIYFVKIKNINGNFTVKKLLIQ